MRACRNTGGNMWCTYNIHRHGNIFGHICCWWVSVWSLRVCRVWMDAAGHSIYIYKVRSLVVQWGSDKQRRQTGCFCVCEGVQIAVYNKPFGRGAYSSMQTMYGVFLNIQWFYDYGNHAGWTTQPMNTANSVHCSDDNKRALCFL